MKRYVPILALALCLAPRFAQAGGAADWFAKHGKGKLEYEFFWHSSGRPQTSRRHRSELRLQLEFDIPLSDEVRLFLAPELRWDTDHMSAGVFDELNRDEVRRPIFHFREAYLEWRTGRWDIRVGEQIFAWGTADGYNPTDNLNPRDYLDLVNNEKIPVFALSATYHFSEATSLELVLIPLFTPSRFDGEESRWSFFPPEPYVRFERERPGDSLSNMQFALRAKTSFEGWDFSLSYYDGYNHIGRPTLICDLLGRPERIRLHYDRVRTLGFDFATTWRGVGIHGELAHTWTQGDRDDSYLQYVLGIDYTWAEIRPGQNLRLILEYAGEKVTRRGRRRDGLPPTRLGRYLDGSILARLVYEFSESAEFELKLAANLRDGSNFYVQPALTFDLNDDWRIKVGADIFIGDDDSFFGRFDDNDRFFLVVEHNF